MVTIPAPLGFIIVGVIVGAGEHSEVVLRGGAIVGAGVRGGVTAAGVVFTVGHEEVPFVVT